MLKKIGKKKKGGNTPIRLPRPFGITQAMVTYHKSTPEEKPELFRKATQFIMQTWLLGNGNLCGKAYNIYELAIFLGCDTTDIQTFMRDRLLSTRIWDKAIQESMVESLVGQQIMWTLEDRMDVQSQLDLLRASQKGKYAPFISSEVNKALKLKLDSTASIQSLTRAMMGNNTVNIFNPVQNNLNQIQQGLTQEEALATITKVILELPEGQEHNDLKYVESKYNFAELPEVIANQQGDIVGDKEGLKIMKKENNKIIDNYKLHLSEKAELDHHEMRREIEELIDIDEDDPEFDEYQEIEE